MKNVAIIGNAIVLAYPRGIRKESNYALGLRKKCQCLVKISILKGEELSFCAERPRISPY